MSERSHVPKALRFEVFKRDKFTCQYCGAKAPDIDAVEGMIELGLGPNDIAEAERSEASWDQFIDRLHAALHAKLEAAA